MSFLTVDSNPGLSCSNCDNQETLPSQERVNDPQLPLWVSLHAHCLIQSHSTAVAAAVAPVEELASPCSLSSWVEWSSLFLK